MIVEIRDYAAVADKLKPFIVPWIEAARSGAAAAAGGGALTAHPLFGAYHTGTLDRSQAPWVATDITTAISAHAALPDVHHARQHNIFANTDHSATGDAFDLVGLISTNTVGKLVPSSAPGATEAILKSSGAGNLTLPTFTATTKITTPTIETASGNLVLSPAGSVQVANSKSLLGQAWSLTAAGVATLTQITTATNQDLLIDPAGNGIVLFPTAQTISSVDFSSSYPITGWRINEVAGITGYSNLTIGSINANELAVKIFTADETRIRRGSQWWTYSNGIVSRDFVVPGSIGGTVRVYFENSPAIAGAIFVNNDWLLLQYVSNDGGGFYLKNVWGQVASYSASSYGEAAGEQSWLFTLRLADAIALGATMKKGSEAIDFGASGAALIQLSVVDASGSPYIDMRRWAGANPYTPANHTTLVKVGNLDGISNSYVTPNGDGIYIRSGAGGNQFLVADDNGLQLRGADFSQYNGSNQTVSISSSNGSVKLGTDISNAATTSFEFDGATGALTIAGSLTATDGDVVANANGLNISVFNNTNGSWTDWDKALSFTTDPSAPTAANTVGQVYGRRRTDTAPDYNEFVVETRTGADYGVPDAYLRLIADDMDSVVGIAAIYLQVSTTNGNKVQIFAQGSDGNYGTIGLYGRTETYHVEPALNNTYDLGTADLYYNHLYARNLHVDTIVGTPSYSHSHDASEITSGTLALALIPATLTGKDADTLDGNHASAFAAAGHNHNDLYYTEAEIGTILGNYVPTTRRVIAGTGLTQVGTGALSGDVTLNVDTAALLTGYLKADGSVTGATVQAQIFTNGVLTSALTSTGALTLSANTSTTALSVDASSQIGIGAVPTNGVAISLYSGISADSAVRIAGTANLYGLNLAPTVAASSGAPQIIRATGTLSVGGNLTTAYALNNNIFVSGGSGNTITRLYGQFVRPTLLNWSGTIVDFYGVRADPATLNGTVAGSLTNYAGFSVGNITNNITGTAKSFEAIMNAGTNRYNLYISGTAENYINGPLGIKTLPSTFDFEVNGTSLFSDDVEVDGVLYGQSWDIGISGLARFAPDQDADHELGRAVIGYGAGTDTAVFSHTDYDGVGAWALAQYSTGATRVNAFLGQSVSVSIGGTDTLAINSDRLLPAGTLQKDLGDRDRKFRALHVGEIVADYLVAQEVISTIGGRVDVAPTAKLVADISASDGTGTSDILTYLEGYWRLEETSGTRSDSSGGTNNLTSNNGVSYATGKQGNAAAFTAGSGQYLSIADNNTLSVADVDFCWAGWIYPTLNNGSIMAVASKGTSTTTAWAIQINWSTSKIYLDVYNSGGTLTYVGCDNFGTLTTNTWYYVMAWHDATANTITISVNGVATSAAHTGGSRDESGAYLIGAYGSEAPSRYFQGRIDEVAFWNGYVPTSTERSWLYNSGTGRSKTELDAYGAASGVITIDIDHNSFTSGTFLYMSGLSPAGAPQFEVFKLTSGYTTIGADHYRYSAQRNVDGTGTNDWFVGDAVKSLGGTVGAGYIALTATETIFNHYGPSIVTYVRTSMTNWDDVAPVTAQGNLRSLVDYATDKYGFALGNNLELTPTTGFSGITSDVTNGLRMFNVDFQLYDGANELLSIDQYDGIVIQQSTSSTVGNRAISWNNGVNRRTYIQSYLSGANSFSVVANSVSGYDSQANVQALSGSGQKAQVGLTAFNGGYSSGIGAEQSGTAPGEVTISAASVSGATGAIRLSAGKILIGGLASDVTGSGVLYMAHRVTAPTSNPANSGGVLYVEFGALKYRGSSGTVTTLAPA